MLTIKQMETLVSSRFNLLKLNQLFAPYGDIVSQGIKDEIESLKELTCADVCRKRHQHFNLPKTKPEDFKERIIQLGENDFILAGIRFNGMDVTKPFVSVWSSTLELSELKIGGMRNIIRKEFSVFDPYAFQMRLPSSMAVPMDSEADRFVIAGLIEEMEGLSSSGIVLETPKEIDFYEKYKDEYELFHQMHPALAREVKREDKIDLQDALRKNLLFTIYIDGTFAGLIAGYESDYNGIKGVCILEELLFHSYRGKGYGPQIQNAFANKLRGKYKILWGTISAKNAPSLKTALSNRRKVIETDYFFNFKSM